MRWRIKLGLQLLVLVLILPIALLVMLWEDVQCEQERGGYDCKGDGSCCKRRRRG